MTCAETIRYKAENIRASSKEAKVKGCGCLGRGDLTSPSWKAHEGQAFERWAESRHAALGKEMQAMKAIVCSGTELRQLRVFTRNSLIVPLGQVKACEGVWKTIWLQP